MQLTEVLKSQFGLDTFRPGQEDLIRGILSGQDVLGVLPTGGGKSLCYQLSALLLPGTTVVISPLLSLMDDQVRALGERGIAAAALSSAQSAAENREIMEIALGGYLRLLYVSPERLESVPEFFRHLDIAQVAVDEAHCISEWGHDFRPAYRRIAGFLAGLPRRPVVSAFTATATREVQQDIQAMLGLHAPLVRVTGFDRPNLFYEVQMPDDRLRALLNLLEEHRGQSGIVYCPTRASVDGLLLELTKRRVNAGRYHAGMTEEERQASQEAFLSNQVPVLVATKAFGMGIDKPDIRFVVHYGMPSSLEAYYQEAGRAGRDGLSARCVVLFSLQDNEKVKMGDARQRRLAEEVEAWCWSQGCLRVPLLRYFGEETGPCSNCGNCCTSPRMEEITDTARQILGCVRGLAVERNYHAGAELLSLLLRGSREKRIRSAGLEKSRYFGILQESTQEQVRDWISSLLLQGYLIREETYHTLQLTKKGERVLQGEKVWNRLPDLTWGPGLEPRHPRTMMDRLIILRMTLEMRDLVSLQDVLSDPVLKRIAREMPESSSQLKFYLPDSVVRWYGADILRVISDHRIDCRRLGLPLQPDEEEGRGN